MDSLTKTKKIAIGAGVLLIAVVGVYYVLLNNIQSLTQEVAALRTQATERLAQQKVRNDVAQFLQSTEADRAELVTYVPRTNDPTPFLSTIESLGQDAGVVLEVSSLTESPTPSVINKNTPPPPILPSVEMVLGVEGSFEHLHHVLTLLEHMPYISSITQIGITRSLETNVWKGQIHLQVTVRTTQK